MEPSTIINNFLQLRRITAPSRETIKFYKGYLTRFFKFTQIEVKDLGDKIKFRNAYAIIYDRDITVNTKIKYLKIMRTFSDFLAEEGIISENVAKKHPTPKNPKKHEREFFDRGEIVDIFQFLDDYYYQYPWYNDLYERNRVIVFTLLYSGIRRSELVNLRVHHVHKDFLFIDSGKGNKDRKVIIPSWLSDMIFGYIKKNNRKDHVFLGVHGNPLQPNAINRIFQKISQHTGVDVYAHKFRHTYATDCITHHLPLNILQSQLGHVSINTTAIYVHMLPDETMKKEIAKINNKYYFC